MNLKDLKTLFKNEVRKNLTAGGYLDSLIVEIDNSSTAEELIDLVKVECDWDSDQILEIITEEIDK